MELVERYLQAVEFWLPKKQQDDIIAELSEDLRAQMEERETELGRELNEPEIEDLLRRASEDNGLFEPAFASWRWNCPHYFYFP